MAPSSRTGVSTYRSGLTRAILSSLLAVGWQTSAPGQQPGIPPSPDPFGPISTELETRSLPTPPWLSGSTTLPPSWLAEGYELGPLQRPGLGTASIGDSPMPSITTSAGGRARSGDSSPIPIGPIDLSLDVSYGLTYGSGLLTGPGQEEASIRQSLTPAMTFLAGDRWSLRYAPTASFYSAEGYKNNLDHSVSLGGSASWRTWDYSLSHATSITSTPLIETGRQTDQTAHSTGLSAQWDMNGRDSLSFSLSQSIRFADGSPDSYSWSNQNWYNRPITDVISAGLGIGVGYDLLDPGTNMVNESLNGRIQGRLGSKFGYSLSGGAEFRQFVSSEAPTKISPLVSASLTYQVLDKTAVFVGFDHSIDVSYFTDQLTENTSFQAGLTQNLSRSWTASVNGAYRLSNYETTFDTSDVVREDSSITAGFTLSWRPTRRLSTALSYSYRSNVSDRDDYDFTSHQFGFRVSYSI